MKKPLATTAVALALCAVAGGASAEPSVGTPRIQSMSALAFSPDGVLFVGDSKGGAVFAVAVADPGKTDWSQRFSLPDLEAKIAALLGTTAGEVMVHDLAVHPVSGRIYLAVSRGRAGWTNRWQLPNDVADATILLRVDGDGSIAEVPLTEVKFARAALPNPIDPGKKAPEWKGGGSMRSDTITDLAVDGGTLWVAGLSNEEFASTLWKLPYPFGDGASATTLEIFHGAHGAFETHAPIRAFVPYRLKGESHLLAAYLCTPFVTFRAAELADGKHVKGRTIGEFGSGNYPLDMVIHRRDGKDRVVIANSSLPLTIIRPEDIESFEGEIVEKPDSYVAGVAHEIRSGTGIQQLDVFAGTTLVFLQRMPGGTLDLFVMPERRS